MKLVSFGNMPINDGVNYVSALSAGGQTPAEASIELAERTRVSPVFSAVNRPARYLVIEAHLPPGTGAQKRALQRQWYQWFENGVARQLVITDDDGSHARYVWAVPVATVHAGDGDGWEWDTMLAVDGAGDPDLAWRSVSESSYDWEVANSGDSLVIDNTGELDAYPVITLTAAGSGGEGSDTYSRFIAVQWEASRAAARYPVNITGGALDTRIGSTHFGNAAGNDIRIYVDGVNTDYWLNGANTAATSIWVNLDFQATKSASLGEGIGAGEISTLIIASGIDGFPVAGLLQIDSELFNYTGKSGNSFVGVTRSIYGTTATSHSGGAGVNWIQHDIILEYGDPSAAAISPNDLMKPMFDLSSSNNGSWVYTSFYETNATRSGAWAFQNNDWAIRYGGNHGASASPFDELGIFLPQQSSSIDKTTRGSAMWYLFNPCGISAANFTNGENYTPYNVVDWPPLWQCDIRSSADMINWTTAYAIPYGDIWTWRNWSYNATGLPVNTTCIAMYLLASAGGPIAPGHPTRDSALECSDVAVTLASPPVTLIYPEIEPAGRIEGALVNDTTGESLAISFRADGQSDMIVIDVDRYVVMKGVKMSFSSVVPDNLRMYFLRLAAGENTLRYLAADVLAPGDVTINVKFERRYLS